MNEKVLSVSIAAYNVACFLEKTLSSICSRSDILEKVEIIIVNDGSKDETSLVAHEYKSQYPDSVLVIDKQNGGYGSTINASLEVASGKYYKLLDGDDIFDSANLSEFINYLESADADLIISPYYEERDSLVLIDKHREIPEETRSFTEIQIEDKFFAMHEIAIRTDMLRDFGEKITEHCFYTDSEFVFYCLFAAKTISLFSDPIYIYRLGVEGQSVSLAGIRKHFTDLPKVAEKLMRVYHKNKSYIPFEKKEIIDLCVRNITYHTYRSYMLLENPGGKRKELIIFDKEISEKYPEAYAIGNRSRLVRILRKLHFHFYDILCHFELKRFLKNQ